MTEQTFDHTYDVVVVGSGTGLMGPSPPRGPA